MSVCICLFPSHECESCQKYSFIGQSNGSMEKICKCHLMAGFNVVSEKKLDCDLLVELQANHVML